MKSISMGYILRYFVIIVTASSIRKKIRTNENKHPTPTINDPRKKITRSNISIITPSR